MIWLKGKIVWLALSRLRAHNWLANHPPRHYFAGVLDQAQSRQHPSWVFSFRRGACRSVRQMHPLKSLCLALQVFRQPSDLLLVEIRKCALVTGYVHWRSMTTENRGVQGLDSGYRRATGRVRISVGQRATWRCWFRLPAAIAASHTQPWLASGSECRGRRLSKG